MVVFINSHNELWSMKAINQVNLSTAIKEGLFEPIIRIGEKIFDVETSFISFINEDNEWVDLHHGFVVRSIICEMPFCIDDILSGVSFLVKDTYGDPRISAPPPFIRERHIRFCAGTPLREPSSCLIIGALIIIDSKPRHIGDDIFRLLSELSAIIEHLLMISRQATHDSLTNVLNRNGFMGIAEKILQQHHRDKSALIILFVDIDGFKKINDEFGHHEGDRALSMFAGVLNEAFRVNDVCARIGGDEFIVLMPNCSLSESESATARMLSALTCLTKDRQLPYLLRCSVGFACYDGNHEPDLNKLLSQADQDMYRKKRR